MDLTVLVSIELAGESFGVVRDRAGSAWLSDSTERICGPRLDDFLPELHERSQRVLQTTFIGDQSARMVGKRARLVSLAISLP
jgi:hypothetical protein